MPLQIGLLSQVIPVTRELFGSDGTAKIVAQVEEAYCGEDFADVLLMDGNNLYSHPGLLHGNRLRKLCNYQLTLEDGEVVLKQSTGFSAVKDERSFRAPPLVLTSTPADNLVRLVERLTEQNGLCALMDSCLSKPYTTLVWRCGVLAEVHKHSGGLDVLCGLCYDHLVKKDAMLPERTLLDARRLLPHAALSIMTVPA